MAANTNKVTAWKLKRLSDESIKLLATSNNIFAAALNYSHTKIRQKFDGSTLKTRKSHIYT